MTMTAVTEGKKTDGQAGAPMPVPQVNTPGARNAALKEAQAKAWKPEDGINPNHPARGRCEIVDADKGIVHEVGPDGQPRKKIAICGFAAPTRQYILHVAEDPAWSVWGLNQLNRHIPRADRWFDIHHNWHEETVPGTDHRGWIRDCGIPVYMHHREPDLPTSVRYPLDAMLGLYQADYFTSTIPYMIAIALADIDAAVQARMQAYFREMAEHGDGVALLRADFHISDIIRSFYNEYTVALFGIDLIVAGEYLHEKACAEFWVGAMAIGRGINVQIPPESALCKQLYRYGWDKEPNQLLRSAEVIAHRDALVKERDEQFKRLCMLEGAIECDTRWEQVIELRARGGKVE